jgi:hypothetical protein
MFDFILQNESFSQNGKPESARYLFAMTHTSFTVVNS